jgi:adenylate kinase family enzyme
LNGRYSGQLVDAIGSRTLIIGNSGSGKSTLAQGIGSLLGIEVFDLDLFRWDDGQRRDTESAIEMTRRAGSKSTWVIEGVFGWLAEVVVERATALIWTDLRWDDCKQGLLARAQRRGFDQAQFIELVAWAEAYWIRDTATSFNGHLRLYDDFSAPKLRLKTRLEIAELVSTLASRVSPPG